jgi:hypothetical protein
MKYDVEIQLLAGMLARVFALLLSPSDSIVSAGGAVMLQRRDGRPIQAQ